MSENILTDTICANLAMQVDVYTQLLQCANDQQEAIKYAKADSLDEVNGRQAELIERADELEEQRMLAVDELCSQQGKQSLTVSELAECSPPAVGGKLLRVAGELRELMTKLQAVNDINKELLRMHFEYAEHMIDAISHQVQISNLYGSGGQEANEIKTSFGFLDSEA